MTHQVVFQSSKEPKTKTSMTKRTASAVLPAFQLTKRDVDIIYSVYSYTLLSTQQIEALHFASEDGSLRTRCGVRLAKLAAHGYLGRVEQAQLLSEGRKPYLYYLTPTGAQLVADMLRCEVSELDWHSKVAQLTPMHRAHLLDSNQIRLRLEQAAARHGLAIPTWVSEHTLRRTHSKEVVTITTPQGGQQVRLIPDGLCVLDTPRGQVHLFIECDRHTETLRATRTEHAHWQRKIMAYTAYRTSGMYQKRYNKSNFRVLTVALSERRLGTLKAATEDAGGMRRFWFSTLDLLNRHDAWADPIWQIATATGWVSFLEDQQQRS
jgi:hypothetical protein